MSRLSRMFSKFELENLKQEDPYTKAEKIAKRVFKGKIDKGGNPYLNHLLYVSNHVQDVNTKIVGLLHDLFEDTEVGANDLREIGFGENIIKTLLLVTRKDNEEYDAYIDRILESNDMTAIHVKKADIENNMDLSRIQKPTQKDIERCENKYKPQYDKIINYLREKENQVW